MTQEQGKKVIEPGFWHIEYDETGNAVKTEYYAPYRKLTGLTEKELENSNDAWFARLHPDDLPRVNAHLEEVFRKDTNAPDFDIEYRLMTPTGYRWFHDNGHITRRADGSVSSMYGTTIDITDHIFSDEITARILKDYFGVITADVDSETLTIVKTSPYFNKGIPGTVLPYKETLLELASVMHGESKTFMEEVADLDSVKTALAKDDKHTTYYRSYSKGLDGRWITLTYFVLSRHEDGTVHTFTLHFAISDPLEVQNLELKERSARDLEIIGGLAEDFVSVYHYNLDTGAFKTYRFNSILNAVKKTLDSDTDFNKVLQSYAGELVHEDERAGLAAFFRPQTVRRNLAHSKSVRKLYRRLIDGNWVWMEVILIKTGEVDAEPKQIVAAFAIRDEEVRREREHTEAFNRLNAISGYLMSSFASVYYCGFTEGVTIVHLADEIKPVLADLVNVNALPAKIPGGYEEGIAKIIEAAYPENDRTEITAVYDRTYLKNRLKNESSFILTSTCVLNGHPVTYRMHVTRGADEDHFTVGYVDITEELEKEHREQKVLEDALSMAQAANKAKSAFLFSMSHDIRTPMNAILGFTSMALKTPDDTAKVTDCLEKTQKSGNLLLHLINSVLDMSRIESGNAELDEKPCDIQQFFADIEPAMQEIAGEKDIELSFVCSNVTDRYVYADVSRISRVLVNLTANAVKYTKESGRVSVSCEETGRDEAAGIGFYRYTVADNGIGMSEEFQKHMYEEFAREETSTVSGIQGTGLGLSVCKSFVSLMHGEISCVSRQGEGTTFTVELPLRLMEGSVSAGSDAGEQGVQEPSGSRPVFIDFTGRRVLLVEDNEMNREIAVDILEDEGLVVDEAEDGSVAVEMVKEKGAEHYDFILMDIQMPVMNGLDTARAIRALGGGFAEIPIIAVSANAFEEDRAASFAAGMNDHIAKPVDVTELMKSLARFFGRGGNAA